MTTQAFNQGYTMDACIVMKSLPDFSQITNSPFLEYEREMSSIRSHFDYEDVVESEDKSTTTEVYPDNPSNSNVGTASKTSNNKNKSPLVWGEDITFLDRRQRENRTIEEAGTQYISLSGFSFFPKDEVTEDLNDICSSLELVDQTLIETHPCTVEEIYQSPVETTLVQDPPVTGRAGLRRTRNASRHVSVVFSEDDNSFCSQSESVNKSSRKRHLSGQSVMSGGSYDDPDDSPYNNNNSSGRKKRRRYEENPSEDPAFEKSRKNAIIAKRNREKKKALMDDMEKQCHKLTKDNSHLESDNGKLRHRVTTLEEEVFYLKSVLANDSALSNVLSGLKNVGNLRFSGNLDQSKYSKKSVASSSTTNHPKTGGICIHVDRHQRISMEKCSECTISVNKDASLDGS